MSSSPRASPAKPRGGEILVSGLLKDLTESSGEFRFEEERQMALKGLAGMHRVVAVDWA